MCRNANRVISSAWLSTSVYFESLCAQLNMYLIYLKFQHSLSFVGACIALTMNVREIFLSIHQIIYSSNGHPCGHINRWKQTSQFLTRLYSKTVSDKFLDKSKSHFPQFEEKIQLLMCVSVLFAIEPFCAEIMRSTILSTKNIYYLVFEMKYVKNCFDNDCFNHVYPISVYHDIGIFIYRHRCQADANLFVRSSGRTER